MGIALTTRTGRVGQHTPHLRSPPDFDTRPAGRHARLDQRGAERSRVPLRPSPAYAERSRGGDPRFVPLHRAAADAASDVPLQTTAWDDRITRELRSACRGANAATTRRTDRLDRLVVGRSDDFVGEDRCSGPRRRGTGSTDRSEIARRELAPLAPTDAAISRRRKAHSTGLRTNGATPSSAIDSTDGRTAQR